MIRNHLFLWALMWFGVAGLNGQVTNRSFNEEADRRDWNFSLTPYALLASQSTNVGGSRLTQSFGELSSITDAGLQLVATVPQGRWGRGLRTGDPGKCVGTLPGGFLIY